VARSKYPFSLYAIRSLETLVPGSMPSIGVEVDVELGFWGCECESSSGTEKIVLNESIMPFKKLISLRTSRVWKTKREVK